MSNHYSKNYLSDVIFRIQLPELNSLNDELARLYKSAVAERFPKFALIKQQGIHIDGGGAAGDVTATKQVQLIWTFSAADDSMTIELQNGSLALVVKKYTDFDDFKEIVLFISAALTGAVSYASVASMGVRYINQIQLDESDKFDWKPYINENLVKSLDFIDNKNTLLRSFQQIFLSLDEESSLTFGFGIFNSLYPSQVLNKEFVLDYDCVTRTPFDSSLVEEKLTYFNTVITDMFEKSITEEMRGVLNG